MRLALSKQLGSGEWKAVSQHTTNDDGRVKDFPKLEAGVYRLVFSVEDYFAQSSRESFYPEAAVVFRVKAGQHYHVPLLVSPFGYSTYRGS
jgi:5-hydroxyisourate hydrolase